MSVDFLKNFTNLLLFLISLFCGFLLVLREALMVPFLTLIIEPDQTNDLTSIDSLAQASYLMIFVSIGEIIGAILTQKVNDRFGKKRVS